MSETERISHVEEQADVPRHKCCWVALLSLCLLTVNSIVCIHLARRLTYVEGQLAKQGVSTSEETSIEERLGDRADLEMSDGAKSKVLPSRGSRVKEHRLYNGAAWPLSPRELEHQNRRRRSETKALHGIEDAKLVNLERHISPDHMTEQGTSYTRVTVAGDVMIKVGGRGHWFPVCLRSFREHEADVACKHLGGQIWPYISGTGKSRNETFWSPVVSCWGDEQNLGECRIVSANARCLESYSVRLSCRAQIAFRLSDGQKPNEGRVVFGLWESVDVYSICKKGWGIHASNVLCRQLGYKRAVPISVDFGPGSGAIFPYDIRCIGNESSIIECQYSPLDSCDHGDVVGVVCDVDDCISNPCQNNGTCIDGVGHYICLCARGWVGVHCQILENLSSMEQTSRDWAHIEAASDSKGDTHTVKLHDTVLTKHWERFEPSEKFRFHSGILTVLEEGDYYIYSQVYYWYNSRYSKSTSHSVMVVQNDEDNPYSFLTCWKYMEETTPWKTCFTAGVIHLSPNNSVYLHMSCDGCVIKLDHDATFFGVIKLSNTRGHHHKSSDIEMHGKKSFSDKVEDDPPTVVHRRSDKSNFEKLIRRNFLTILNELTLLNGSEYHITRRGKIVLRRN